MFRLVLCISAGAFILGAEFASAEIPGTLSHQGAIAVNGQRFTGNGAFRFALVDAGTDAYLWVNDGSLVVSPDTPTNAVILQVVNGVYNVALGNALLTNMTALPPGVFNANDNVVVRVWFDDGVGNGVHQLSPDQSISSVPFSHLAEASERLNIPGEDTSAVFVDSVGNVTIDSNLTVDTNTLFVDSTTGNVGIGQTAPSAKLDVVGQTELNGDVSINSELTVAGIVDSTIEGFRFPDGSVQTTAAFGDGHSLDAVDGIPANALFVNTAGTVGIGTTIPNAGKLKVEGVGTTSFLEPAPAPRSHTMFVESTSVFNPFALGGFVLSLKSRWSDNPGNNVNFVTFYDSTDEAIGAIEGNGANGVVYKSGSADFAEYLPKLNAADSFEPGEVVGVMGGRVSKSLSGANYAMVVSTAPAVLGNAPHPDALDKFVTIAMLGQIPVKVTGRVQQGDYIVADPGRQGVAIAVSADQLAPDSTQWIIGRAWGSSNDTGVKLINTAVGITGAHVAQLAAELADQRREIEELKSHESRIANLEMQIAGGCE